MDPVCKLILAVDVGEHTWPWKIKTSFVERLEPLLSDDNTQNAESGVAHGFLLWSAGCQMRQMVTTEKLQQC